MLSLKRFNPQIWLPTLTLAWGLVSVGQGLIKNQAGLLGIRFCTVTSFPCSAVKPQTVHSIGRYRSGSIPRFHFSVLYVLPEVSPNQTAQRIL